MSLSHLDIPDAPDPLTPLNQKCTICGVILASEQAPSRCPECGARSTMFRATDEPPRCLERNPLLPRDAREISGEVLGPHAHGGCLERD